MVRNDPYAARAVQAIVKEFDALEAAGKPHDLVRLDGEDHWLSYPETRLAMLTRLIGFLETHNPPN